MSITIDLPDDFFTQDERQRLERLFKAKGNAKFSEALQKVVRAALNEYKEMFLGISLPSRAGEIRERRLLHLIKHYFLVGLPSEAEVSSMFQLTRSQSKSLIRNVMTKFHYDLKQEALNTLIKTVDQAKWNANRNEYHVAIQSDVVLNELNRIIGTEIPHLDPVSKVKDMARTYSISKDSRNALVDNSYYIIRKYLGF
jgi:hypothetical protein